jgi:DNA-binding ferritin-like protein (Dps family)
MTMWIEKIVGDLGDRKKYRKYRERVRALPDGYRQAAQALERYLMNLGPTGGGKNLIMMLNDLADLLEQSVAAGTPLRDVVGADPDEFAEDFLRNYDGSSWIRSERERLGRAIDRAERAERP